MNFFKTIGAWILARLQEKTTWIGIFTAVVTLGLVNLTPEQASQLADAMTSLFGFDITPEGIGKLGVGLGALLTILRTKKGTTPETTPTGTATIETASGDKVVVPTVEPTKTTDQGPTVDTSGPKA